MIYLFLLLAAILVLPFLYVKFLLPLHLRWLHRKRLKKPMSFLECDDESLKISRDVVLSTSSIGEFSELRWTSILKADLLDGNTLEILPRTGSPILLKEEEFEMDKIRETALWCHKKISCTPTLTHFCEEMMARFQGCRFCGRLAVLDQHCVNCVYQSFEKEWAERKQWDDEIDERTFLKEEQLDWFDNGDGGIDLAFDEPNIFEKDPNWRLED